MEAGSESRLRSTLGVFGTAFRNRSLLLVELAWLAFNSAEWGVWLTLMVWAYTYGGAAAASLIVIVQLVPVHLHLAVPRRHHRPGARRPRALHRPADHGRHAWRAWPRPWPSDAPPLARLRPRADHEPRALRPAAGAGGAAAERRAHAARAHRRQRRLQLDGERQRAHRARRSPACCSASAARRWRPACSPACTLAGAFLVVGIPGPRPHDRARRRASRSRPRCARASPPSGACPPRARWSAWSARSTSSSARSTCSTSCSPSPRSAWASPAPAT